MVEHLRDALGLNNLQMIGILAGILLFLAILSMFLRSRDSRVLRFIGTLIKWTLISAFALTVAFFVLPKKFTIWAIEHKFLGLVTYVAVIVLVTILFSWIGEEGNYSSTSSNTKNTKKPQAPKPEPDRYMVGDRRFKTFDAALRYSNWLKQNNISPNNIVNL
ncbi:MAG: hypothetical protein MJY56_04510 [Bacteroidales bacterium]|nr:hypothetical protein [Bacteroidales bacterium]